MLTETDDGSTWNRHSSDEDDRDVPEGVTVDVGGGRVRHDRAPIVVHKENIHLDKRGGVGFMISLSVETVAER